MLRYKLELKLDFFLSIYLKQQYVEIGSFFVRFGPQRFLSATPLSEIEIPGL